MQVVSWSGVFWVASVSFLLVFLFALRRGGWRQAAIVLLAALLDLSTGGIKSLVDRPRPFPFFRGETDSFPSGHTVHVVLLLGVLWLLVAPRLPQRQREILACLFMVVALLVGVSRVYLGRHWPSDVLGAYLVAALALGCLWWGCARLGLLRTEKREALSPAGRRGRRMAVAEVPS